MTDCNVIRDLMPLYADGQASEATVRLVEAHTANCPHCRTMLDRMTAPMEPEPEDARADFERLLRKQRRKFVVRVLLVCLVMAMVWLIGWWIHMERSFDRRENRVVTTNASIILSQMPQLALTEAEQALADTIRSLPAVEAAIAAGELTQDIATAHVAEEIGPVLPEDAEQLSVYVVHSNPAVEYCTDDLRVILEFLDPDNDGAVDCVRKTVGVLNRDGHRCDTVYTLEYYPAFERTYYEKYRSGHVLFGFLQQS